MFRQLFRNKSKHESDERLDRLGRKAVRMSALRESEAAEIASSPFLYARLRAHIAAESERREAGGGWLVAARRAVPAMALATAVACGLFWFAGGAGQAPATRFSIDAFFGVNEAGMGRVVFAGGPPLSRDEALATIVSRDEHQEVSR
ncbi:MAG: hypothetical protein ACREEM_27290 [Blastocatellia bacterium]